MIKYGQLLGKVRIHPLFWLVAGIAMLTGYFWELSILFMIVMIHELGHAAAAHFFSWKIKRILILPFGGTCEVDEHGNRPIFEELVIVAAGPLQHIWLAAAAAALASTGLITKDSALLFHKFNLMIFLFNLLPVWPLDGGKLLYLTLSVKKPFLNAMKETIIISLIMLTIVLLILIGVSPFNLHLWIVLLYLYTGLWFGWKQVRYAFMRFLLERYYGKQSGIKRLEVIEAKGNDYIYQAMEKFQRDCKHLIHVDSGRSMDENEMLHVYFAKKQVNIRLKEIDGL
ncbi:stage IV sporulation protein FB [Bacillus freudenreichii]|nr:stage IV sporulation protein FB [Bacillus freudenreichii]